MTVPTLARDSFIEFESLHYFLLFSLSYTQIAKSNRLLLTELDGK